MPRAPPPPAPPPTSEAPSLDATSALTIEVWIKLAAYPSGLGFLYDTDNEYSIGLLSNGRLHIIAVAGGSTLVVDSNQSVPLGEWHHVSLRYDATTTLDVVIDGAVHGSMPANGALSNLGTNGSRIGGDAGAATTPPVIGSYDEVRVWRVARSNADL